MSGQHQPRTLRLPNVGKHNPDRYEARVSREDEAIIAKQARRKDVAGELTRLEDDLKAQLRRLRDPEIRPTRQTYRDLGSAIALVGRVRAKLTAEAS